MRYAPHPMSPEVLARLDHLLLGMPPSYRTFVERDPELGRILAAADYNTAWFAQRVGELRDAVLGAGGSDPFATGVPLAVSPSATRFVVLEHGAAGQERAVVEYDLQQEVARFPDFTGFLQNEN